MSLRDRPLSRGWTDRPKHNMISAFFDALAAQPRLYDLIQYLVGAPKVRRRVAQRVARFDRSTNSHRLVIDIGGGTGLNHALIPHGVIYICLDLDPLKLEGFLKKYPGGIGLLGDGLFTPLSNGCADIIFATAVAHHIPNVDLMQLFHECVRILSPGGRFVFLDPVWNPQRMAGRWLWKYDRGSFPRSTPQLLSAIEKNFTILHSETFAIYHEYLLCIAEVLS